MYFLFIAWLLSGMQQIFLPIWAIMLKLRPIFQLMFLNISLILFLISHPFLQFLKFTHMEIRTLFSPLTQYIYAKILLLLIQMMLTLDRLNSYYEMKSSFHLHKLDRRRATQNEQFKFRLCCLPVVAASEVVKSMNIPERIKLAIASRRMENLVKRASSKTPMTFIFDIYNENPQICIENEKETVATIGEITLNPDQKNCIGVRQFVPWLNRKHSHLWNMTDVFKKLRRIIPIETFELSLNTRQLSVEFLKELIAIPELSTIQIVTIDGKQVESDLLRILMDWCDKKVEFGIDNNCIVPLDYHHEKAFKFSTVFYDDARWVKVEDLLTLENSDEVILNENTLTSKDINLFLKFWMESDLNMFREFHMWADILDMKDVLKDIMHVKTSRDDKEYSIIKASQKLKFLSINIGEDLILHVNSLDESDETFQKEYKVLELMEQRKRLKTELEALEGEEAQRLTMEIRGLTKELDSLCDYFNDERAIISL